MQIRVRGMKVEFLRAVYLPHKKRSTQKLLGSMPAYGYDQQIPSELKEKLTEEEIEEVEAYLKKQREEREERSVRYSLLSAGETLAKMAQALDGLEAIKSEKAAEIYAGLDQVARALRKKGFTREKIRAEQKND